MFGNMEEIQKKLREKLVTILVEAQAGDGAVTVQANATRAITNISIDSSKIDLEDTEQLEDLLLVAINRAIELAAEKEAAEGQNMLKEMMPPGMGGLSDLFG